MIANLQIQVAHPQEARPQASAVPAQSKAIVVPELSRRIGLGIF